jgi:hypothetical protein
MAWSRNHYTFYAVNPVQEKGDESKKTVSVAYYVEVLAGSDPLDQNSVPDSPTVINLSSLTATPKAGKIILDWTTESETNNAGFNLYRSDAKDGKYTRINTSLIPDRGAPTQGASHEFVDKDVKNVNVLF